MNGTTPPPFDPSKPFTTEIAPPFDPSKPFTTMTATSSPQPPPINQAVTPESDRPPNEAEGFFKTLWESLTSPGQKGAEAGARIAGSALEATGAMAGSMGDLPVVGTARAAAAAPESRALLSDFERAGVTPNLPTVGQGRTAALVSNVANTLPISGPQVRVAMNRTVADTAAAAERSAGQYGAARLPIEGGEAAQRGLTKFATQDFPQQAQELYGDFEHQMAGAPPVDVSHTVKALEGPMRRFPSTPELGEKITDPKLRGFANTISGAGGELTFPELQEFRSYIGRLIGDPVLVSQIPRADLKNVYAGISADLRAAAAKQSPEALAAFDKANAFYKAGIERVDDIEFLTKGSPEQAFSRLNRAAESGGSANAGLLAKVKESVGPKEWGNVGSAVIARLGEPTAGQKDMLANAHFSLANFSTNWNKLSSAAKDELFGQDVPGSPRSGLETLARISQAQKNVGKLENRSRSGEYGVMLTLAFIAIDHYATLIEHPIATVSGVGSIYGASKVLMSPQFARWLYSLPTMIEMGPTLADGARRAGVVLAAVMSQPSQETPRAAQVPPAWTLPQVPAYQNMIGQMP